MRKRNGIGTANQGGSFLIASVFLAKNVVRPLSENKQGRRGLVECGKGLEIGQNRC